MIFRSISGRDVGAIAGAISFGDAIGPSFTHEVEGRVRYAHNTSSFKVLTTRTRSERGKPNARRQLYRALFDRRNGTVKGMRENLISCSHTSRTKRGIGNLKSL